jgi:hypothetical protein
MALTAAEIADRLDSASTRLQELLALDAQPGGMARADAKVRLRLAQEFLFHAIGAADAAAQILNDRRKLGIDEATIRSVYARLEQGDATDPCLAIIGGLGHRTRERPVPPDPYTDDAVLFRAMLYRHSVIHAHVHPFVFTISLGDDAAPAHLRIDPRLGPNDPPYGPNGNISKELASDELRRILALCRVRTTKALALP